MVLLGALTSAPRRVCQRTLPSAAERHIAASAFEVASVELTKTRSPTMMGVASPGPGSAADQATPSVRLHVAGRPVSGLEPLKSGPRQWGQSAARAGPAARVSSAAATSQLLGIRMPSPPSLPPRCTVP